MVFDLKTSVSFRTVVSVMIMRIRKCPEDLSATLNFSKEFFDRESPRVIHTRWESQLEATRRKNFKPRRLGAHCCQGTKLEIGLWELRCEAMQQQGRRQGSTGRRAGCGAKRGDCRVSSGLRPACRNLDTRVEIMSRIIDMAHSRKNKPIINQYLKAAKCNF